VKIYFAGSIRGGRDDAELYIDIIEYLKNFGEVLTEHIGNNSISSNGETNMSDLDIHDRDMNWLLDSNIIIAEVTNPSLGVGYEIGRALENNKKIICLYRENNKNRLSAMISGSKKIININYSNLNDFKLSINKYLKKT
tara:strand:- start:47 stop:463 length:417 start_codon:yes stop_codon:yes gene_type:complete